MAKQSNQKIISAGRFSHLFLCVEFYVLVLVCANALSIKWPWILQIRVHFFVGAFVLCVMWCAASESTFSIMKKKKNFKIAVERSREKCGFLHKSVDDRFGSLATCDRIWMCRGCTMDPLAYWNTNADADADSMSTHKHDTRHARHNKWNMQAFLSVSPLKHVTGQFPRVFDW